MEAYWSVWAVILENTGYWTNVFLTPTMIDYFYINHGDKGFFQFKIIINVLASSSRFIWMPLLWVYGHYQYLIFFNARTVFKRQNLTSTDVRFWRVKAVPALKVCWFIVRDTDTTLLQHCWASFVGCDYIPVFPQPGCQALHSTEITYHIISACSLQ